MKCQCEADASTGCHGPRGCKNDAVEAVKTIYGTYQMCASCAKRLPAKYKVSATDSTRKAPARLHRALDAILDARPARAKDLNTTPPRDALASQAKARAWLESLQERMQPAYAAEEEARERYKNASRDQRYRYDLEKKWNIASAKVAQLEKEWDQAHAAVKRAIPGFEW